MRLAARITALVLAALAASCGSAPGGFRCNDGGPCDIYPRDNGLTDGLTDDATDPADAGVEASEAG
jgi:hypothetical protein